MMRKILLTAIISAILAESVYAAAIPDDDSAIYSPYPAQPQQTEQPAPKTSTPKRKPAPKKAAPKRKPVPQKAAPKRKPAVVRQSSLQKGIELMQQERYEKAKPYLLKAIQEERNNPNAWYWYGVYHEKTGGFYQAQYFYTKAVTIDPAFEPLSRVVFYPNDDEKTPLWDPKHPARVYPVETASVPMNVSEFPNAPDDPEIPQVPVYVPPEPGAEPTDGDHWSPSVYVPPRPEELPEYANAPIYMPPDASGVVADEERSTIEIPIQNEPRNDDIITERNAILKLDKPVYNPPAPDKAIQQKTQTQKSPAVKSPAKQESPSRKSSTVPEKRVVRQKKASATSKTPAKTVRQKQRTQAQPESQKTESKDVKPQTPTQTRRQQNQSANRSQQTQTQTQTQTQRQQNQTPTPNRNQRQQTPTPVPPPARPTQPETTQPRRENEYMPPVGQYAPDPGTIPDRPMPPVGQGN